MKSLGMCDLKAIPKIPDVEKPSELWMKSGEERKHVLLRVCGDVVDQFISFQYNGNLKHSKDKVRETICTGST